MTFFDKIINDIAYFNQPLVYHIVFFILGIIFVYYLIKNTKIGLFLYPWLFYSEINNNEKDIKTNQINKITENKLKVSEADELINFLDKIIKTKFNFYFINEILPFYQAGEKIDKPTLKEIQERFYIDVSALLNKDFKKLYKKYFTTQGIEIYINEKFIYFLNKFDSLNTEEKITDTTIHKLLK